MANDVVTAGQGLVDLFNNGTFSQDVTAYRSYDVGSIKLTDLTARIDVWLSSKTKVRNDRSLLKITAGYTVLVRKFFDDTQITDGKTTASVLDDWLSFIDELENVKWQGRETACGLNGFSVDSVEVVTPYDIEKLKSESMLVGLLNFTLSWYANQ